MPSIRIVRVPAMTKYAPPSGFRIVLIQGLKDGSYEVTLEPWELLS